MKGHGVDAMGQPHIHGVVDAIAAKNETISNFWRDARDWAPDQAAHLLSKSRLDRQVTLSHTLKLWVEPDAKEGALDLEGRLVLGWANLGALVEGSMKWFLCVYYKEYEQSLKDRAITLKAPGDVTLKYLREFFSENVWVQLDVWDPWVERVQTRRNAIHAFNHREVGTLHELELGIRRYLDFLDDLDGRVPYPDEVRRQGG
jgi:hypothetical protein